MTTGVQAAARNEWNFEVDPAGRTLSAAYNSGTEGAAFASGGTGSLETDGQGSLVCTHTGTSMWTDGAKLDANIIDATSGVHYLSYDLHYSIDSSFTNSVGAATGLSFVDRDGSRVAGLFFSYDPLNQSPPAGATRTPLATNLAWQGTIGVIAKVDLDAKTISVWYRLSGSAAFDELSPTVSSAPVTIDSIGSLRFQATGLFRPAGSSDYVAIDAMRMASSWSEITAATPAAFLTVHNSYQNNMVLQRDTNTPVRGKALPGATVTVRIDGTSVGSAVANASGDWIVRITPQANDGGVPHVVSVETAGATTISFSNVIFGDVYLAAGQSNMQFAMANVIGFAATEAGVTNPLIRHAAVRTIAAAELQYEPVFTYQWESATPATIGHFTAVGYFFAKNVYAQTGVPVGIINASYGGQSINRFLNPDGVRAVPQLAGLLTAQELGIVSNYYDLYNAMVGPMAPYGVCGFLWYQAEADCGTYGTYEYKMRALMRGYRSAWGDETLPFYYVQLPNYTYGTYPNMREEQLRALTEPGAAMAVTIDVGDDSNIHPTNKQDPGYRLAQWALARRFGQSIDYSGPVYAGTLIESNQVRVLFDYAESGLIVGQKISTNALITVTNGTLENFEVAGSNLVFVAADAVIDKDTVLVSSPSVSAPQYVRYCYRDTLGGTNKLYNASGLPASPFRSDETWYLQVVNGSGTAANVNKGTVVSITANTPSAGQVFDRWIGAAVADPNSSSTTITMPTNDVYLIATYRDSAAQVYSLSVVNGSGSGTVQAGARIMIQANPPEPGMSFAGWTGDTGLLADAGAAATSLIMPSANVSVTAAYTAAPPQTAAETTAFRISAGACQFRFLGQAGQRYRLDRATNLLNPVWSPVFYNIKGDGLENRLQFNLEPGVQAFYRLRPE